MRIVIAATPASGHVNPIAAIGRILVGDGHDVVALSGNAFRQRFEGIGARFRRFPPARLRTSRTSLRSFPS